MPADDLNHAHLYTVTCSWSGSTGDGYDAYRRDHQGTAAAATAELNLSADPAFHGDPTLWNPEQLLVMAAASCQLLSFLAVAARARIDVVGYQDNAVGEMPENEKPLRLTRIVLRPEITVAGPVNEDRVRRLVHLAHDECYIANSLKTPIAVEPTIVAADRATGS